MNLFYEKVEGFYLITGYIGLITIFVGLMCLVPLLTLIFYPEEIYEAKYFIAPGVTSILIGYFLYFFIRGKKEEILKKSRCCYYSFLLGYCYFCLCPSICFNR